VLCVDEFEFEFEVGLGKSMLYGSTFMTFGILKRKHEW